MGTGNDDDEGELVEDSPLVDSLDFVNMIVDEAKDRWKREDVDQRRDDITIVIVSFDWNNKKPNKASSDLGDDVGNGSEKQTVDDSDVKLDVSSETAKT